MELVTRGYHHHQAVVVTASSGGVTIFDAELANPSLFLFCASQRGSNITGPSEPLVKLNKQRSWWQKSS